MSIGNTSALLSAIYTFLPHPLPSSRNSFLQTVHLLLKIVTEFTAQDWHRLPSTDPCPEIRPNAAHLPALGLAQKGQDTKKIHLKFCFACSQPGALPLGAAKLSDLCGGADLECSYRVSAPGSLAQKAFVVLHTRGFFKADYNYECGQIHSLVF